MDEGTTTVLMDTGQKMQESLEQVSNDNFYKLLETPIVSSTMAKLENIVKNLFDVCITLTYDLQVTFFRPKLSANTRILHAYQNTQKHSCRQTNCL